MLPIMCVLMHGLQTRLQRRLRCWSACLAASMPGMSQRLDHDGHLAVDLIPRTSHLSQHCKSLRSCISGPILWQAKCHGIVPPHIRVSARTVQRLWSAHGLDPDLLQPILQSGLVVGLGPDRGWVLGDILEMVGLSHFSKPVNHVACK